MSRKAHRVELRSGASIPSLVRHAHRGARLARFAEACLLGAAGLALGLAAAINSGGNLGTDQVWGVAIFTALLVGVSSLVASFQTPLETARSLDQRLRFSGALLTAYESQRDERQSDLVDLLSARIAGRLTPGIALRAARPLTFFPIAAPFVAAAFLALAIESADPPKHPAGLAALAREISGEIASARRLSLESLEAGNSSDLGAEASEIPRALSELLSKVARIESEWQRERLDPEAALDAIERLNGELSRLVRDWPATGPLADNVRRVSNLLGAAALRAQDAASAASGGAAETQGSDPSLASGQTGGRMSGTENTDGATSASPDGIPGTSQAALEQGAVVANRWLPEYDEIVARWVESRRSVNNSER